MVQAPLVEAMQRLDQPVEGILASDRSGCWPSPSQPRDTSARLLKATQLWVAA